MTSALNLELASTKNISTKVKKVESIYQAINTYFNLKARSWQVGGVIDISKRKRDICPITGINVSKNFIYESILWVIGNLYLLFCPQLLL